MLPGWVRCPLIPVSWTDIPDRSSNRSFLRRTVRHAPVMLPYPPQAFLNRLNGAGTPTHLPQTALMPYPLLEGAFHPKNTRIRASPTIPPSRPGELQFLPPLP